MDNAHAHPSPTASLPARPRTLRDYNATPRSISPPTRQQRLLRTRNAKFPAKKLSISGISARFSHLIRANEEPRPHHTPTRRSNENLAPRRSRGSQHASLSSSSLGILEEITGSISGRHRSIPKRASISVFEDTPERGLLEESPVISPAVYHDASSEVNSPLAFDHIQDSLQEMGLREISGNARKPSPLEPLQFSSIVKTGRRPRSTPKTRFNSEEYIDHIERELQSVKDAMHSPTTNRPWKETMKVAKAENERLRTEIMEMRNNFESEVHRTVEHMTTTELELRRKVRWLQDELEHKNLVIQDLQHDNDEKRVDQGVVETLKATIERLEQEKLSLEDANYSCSKRNEVLTQLLAFSPSRTQPEFELTTPLRRQKSARPMSMMIPKLPSSPSTRFSSRPQSLVGSPVLSAAGYFSPRAAVYPCPSNEFPTDPEKQPEDDASVDSGLGESCSLQSTVENRSRRSTNASQVSFSPTSWGIPMPVSPPTEQPIVRQHHRRRTRKFLPGSTQLKPFLLPVLTGENGLLHSSSPITSPVANQRREVSEESIDPTTSFLSKSPSQSGSESEHCSPRDKSSGFIGEDTIRPLLATFEDTLVGPNTADQPHYEDADLSETTPDNTITFSHSATPLANLVTSSTNVHDGLADFYAGPDVAVEHGSLLLEKPENSLEIDLLNSSSPSLQKSGLGVILRELGDGDDRSVNIEEMSSSAEGEVPPRLFLPTARRHTFTERSTFFPELRPPSLSAGVRSHVLPRKRRNSSSMGGEFDTTAGSVPLRSPCLNYNSTPDRSILAPVSILGRAEPSSPQFDFCAGSTNSVNRSRRPLEVLQQHNLGSRPLAAVTIKTIYGTLSKYTTYIKDFKRDPLALARRVLANAWRSNWSVIGKLSWWVLGLFLGPSSLRPPKIGVDWDKYDGETIANKHCRKTSKASQTEIPSDIATSSARIQSEIGQREEPNNSRGCRSKPRSVPTRKKLGWGQSLFLWGKFSVAIMLAVTGAVVKGPGEMLRETQDHRECSDHHEQYQDNIETQHPTPTRSPIKSRRSSEPDRNGKFVQSNCELNDSRSSPSNRQRHKHRKKTCITSESRSPILDYVCKSSSPLRGSPSPAFRFGHQEAFHFKAPSEDHDWGDGENLDTLKPAKVGRKGLAQIFPSPVPVGRICKLQVSSHATISSTPSRNVGNDDPGGETLSEYG